MTVTLLWKKIQWLVLIFCLSVTAVNGQKNPAYQLFKENGKKVSYGKMLKQIEKADIVLFGEYHNNPICHWLQFELAKDLMNDKLVIGAEMFERDNEQALANYLSGTIDGKALDTLARLWPNYETDYRPVVDLAKEEKIPFVSTNIPRRYANLVYRKGFEGLDTLSAEEKSWIAPLPVAYDPELPGYKAMLDMMPGHGGENFPKAQAIKDVTMAHFILENHKPGGLSLHLNGTYHSDNFEGILWYLREEQPDLQYITISTVEQNQLKQLDQEHKGKANFILVIPETMTKTY
ncbi:MAG: ChaN family lipoprotein [Saprospiraceae bacterium]|nr:ChaN family lipoprotein [Saprospiraceae bacterium]